VSNRDTTLESAQVAPNHSATLPGCGKNPILVGENAHQSDQRPFLIENRLREKGGGPAYRAALSNTSSSLLLYPASLTKASQIAFGALALIVDAGVYGFFGRRKKRAGMRLVQRRKRLCDR
jgi:hypothetical protein